MNRATIFMGASWVGLGGLLLFAGSQVPGAPPAAAMIGNLLLIVSSLVLFTVRRADEYTVRLWNAGASAAFGAILIGFFGLSIAEGFIDGLLNLESNQDIPVTLAPLFALAAFYIGLFARRLLGGE